MVQAEAAETQEELLTVKQVCELLGVARQTLYCWQRKGIFIQPLRVGVTAVRYPRSEIVRWLETRPRARREVGGSR